ncbi:5'-nucleotidase C-terminal domain-containing protein [Myxococcota bacterium]|nr:5'-nucleotidase C-terminal domain-containing protein [Myxococcota bacterium]MBU1380674.1 5'-nucleotidase C-terminal domain-containing protein [Myxococcota bacterium]MBU1495882.1 5'-nucleotidase C-terminal domain-containing protein [Myxococcota bacterium]
MRSKFLLLSIITMFSFLSCLKETDSPDLRGHDVEVTFIHTADWHSRLLPYYLEVGETDKALGLNDNSSGVEVVGGAARAGTIIKRIRSAGGRVIHLDTGDVFQGAPIFNEFLGEVEFRIYSHLKVDAFAVGNHEFDMGVTNFVNKANEWASFPMLNINYALENPYYPGASPLGAITYPYQIVNVQGLRVAIIGVGSLGSIVSMYEGGNSLGITPIDTLDITQFYIDWLRPISDVIVISSHLGLRAEKQMERGSEDQVQDDDPDCVGDSCASNDLCVSNQRLVGDEQLIANTEGIDVFFGGHLHIVLSPPEVVDDCTPDLSCPELIDEMEKRGCLVAQRDQYGNATSYTKTGSRKVPLMHSGAFLKFIGQMDTVFGIPELDSAATPNDIERHRINGWELKAFRQIMHPMNESVPLDPDIEWILDQYRPELYRRLPLTRYIAYAPVKIRRFATGFGDSALGNLVSTAIQVRRRIETDFSLTNTLGIRSDIEAGPVSIETMYNVFPFENTITTLTLSGSEVKALLDYVALRSSRRGCQAQAQVAGVTMVMNCNDHVVFPYKDEGSFETAHRITIGGSRLTDPTNFGIDDTSKKPMCSYDGVRCTSGTDCPDDIEPVKSCPDGTSFGNGGCCPAGELCTPNGCGRPINLLASYTLAANDYIAAGGSGFRVLQFNTTQYNTGIPLRDAVIDFMYINYAGCGVDLDDQAFEEVSTFVSSTSNLSATEFTNAFSALLDSLRGSDDVTRMFTKYANCAEDMADLMKKDCSYLPDNSDAQLRCKIQKTHGAVEMCIDIPCIEAREDGRIDRIFPISE